MVCLLITCGAAQIYSKLIKHVPNTSRYANFSMEIYPGKQQVAAKCGVSNGQQLTDSLLHLTLDSDLSSFIIPTKSSTTSTATRNSLALPYTTFQQGHSNRAHLAEYSSSINQSNGHSTNNSQFYSLSANSLSGGKCCGNSGVSGVGVAKIVGGGQGKEDQESDYLSQLQKAIQHLCIFELKGDSNVRPSPLSSSENELGGKSWCSGASFRMVLPARGQNTGNVVKSHNTTTPSKNSANKNKSSNHNNNSNNSNNNSNSSKNKNIKNTEPEDQRNNCCVTNKRDKSSPKKYTNSATSSGKEEEEELKAPGHPPPSKAVDAKEVKKLLEDALWKSQQQSSKDSSEGAESVNSGGCDTGYSSRCSTPPSPPSLPPDQTSNSADPKHGTKRHLDVPVKSSNANSSSTNGTRESRSESPSACSVSSQGSYRNPRQKRRYNSHHVEGYGNRCHSNGHYHHNHHQQHHHSQQQQYPNHYPYNQQGGGYGGGCGRGNNQYYHYLDHVPRDCTNYHGRRYDRGYMYNCYQGHYNYYGRDVNQYNSGDGYRYNHGRGGYNNRYHNNQRNYYNENFPPLDGGNVRDQSKSILSDRAGTFSNDCVSDNKHWKCEVTTTPKELLTGSEWDGLSQQVWDTFCKHQQTDKTFFKKLKLKEKIFKVIRNVLPNCRLYVVGSSLSGFGADWSDVDMCLMVTAGDLDQRNEATVVLSLLQRELNNCGSTQKMELIRAKVPILKFRDAQTLVDVDLNCNNAVGIRNTHLLHSYSQLDWRVRPLVLVVKLWAQHHNINNAKDMTISSYSLVLMVIHYLQHGVQPPVLPCLQKSFPDKFHDNAPIMSIPITERMPTFTSNNHDTLGQLFHGFLNYFANTFTYIEDTISVRTGGTIPTAKCRAHRTRKNDSRMWKYLCIEEPFDRTNTARSMYDEEVFERVKKVFADSYKLLNEKRDLSAIM
ncbi:poly(A) RNA polymerase gld-2-like isoform X1 [Macrobrachium nipponense]|uniref:poly(A) RNA polymerase gld-2-like isoform X1 n=1 Tax=Macrobrachium nipponense TaxID=159736 RepID=UPI0030C82C2F